MEILITSDCMGLSSSCESDKLAAEKLSKLLGDRRLGKIELKDNEINAQFVIFRPAYGLQSDDWVCWSQWWSAAKEKYGIIENVFSELWEYIEKHPDDPVESISLYTFGEYGDLGSDFLEVLKNISDDIKSKIRVLTCECTHSDNKNIGMRGGIALDKEGYNFSVRRISCKDLNVVPRTAKFLVGDREHWPLKWSRVNRHPFYIDKMNWV